MKSKYRKGVFIVVYARNKKNNFEYLILKRHLHWSGWEFPKGGVKKEKLIESVKRELREETHVSPLSIKNFHVSGKYKYGGPVDGRDGEIGQTYEGLYAVEAKKCKIKFDTLEHNGYRWLNFNEAVKILTWKNQKDSIKLVNEWLMFRKFRTNITTSGTFIFSGKNKKQNEELVSLFKGKENIIMHTVASGSPFCVIDKIDVSKKDIKECAVICAKNSQDWRNNKSDVDVNIFNGKKIYKMKIMPIGTFGVKSPKKIIIKAKEIKSLKK